MGVTTHHLTHRAGNDNTVTLFSALWCNLFSFFRRRRPRTSPIAKSRVL